MTLGSRLSGRRTTSLTAAVLVTAAAGLVGALGGAAPAQAADCAAGGVTVVADFNELGGGVPTVCVSDGGGKTAATLFEAAGRTLSEVPGQRGFVFRVDGAPSRCAPSGNAYWSLWWSDGEPGSSWTYSTLGAYSLKVPAGGLVAFSWDQVDGDEQPSASASRPVAPTPSPTPAPTPAPTPPTPTPAPGGSGGGNGDNQSGPGNGSASAAPTPAPQAPEGTEEPTPEESATPSETAGQGAQETKRPKKQRGAVEDGDAEPTADATTEAEEVPEVSTTDPALDPETEAGQADSEGLPGFVAPTLIVLLFGGAAVAWWVRRRSPVEP